jgi:hypothetical protein
MPRRGSRLARTVSALAIFVPTAHAETPRCPLEKPAILFHTGMPPEWGVTMPQIGICTEDVDCAGCGRCLNGVCRQEQTWETCMCHDECAPAGPRSCARSSQKPLCPGVCSASPPTRPMACGSGDDAVRLEPFAGRRCFVEGAATASAQAIVSSRGSPSRPSGSCRAACPGVEAVGPVSELVIPGGGLVEQAAVTFAHGRWYAAWSGRHANATMVQRFARDGRIEGPALRIEGMAVRSFLEASGEIVLLGWVGPAYTAAGAMVAIHRLTADLEPVGAPVLLRSPGDGAFDFRLDTAANGELIATSLLDRKGMLVREVRVPPAVRTSGTLPSRDWWPGVGREGALARLDGQPYFLDGSQGALRIRALQDGSVLGAPRLAFPIPVAEGRQIVFSRRVGDRWYVGAHAATSGPVVRVGALEPSTLDPDPRVIELLWPIGSPYGLVDGNGTPILLGSVDAGDRSIRPSLVPLDFASGAACGASTLSVPSVLESYQTVRALAFEGGVGAAVITAWGTTDFVSRAFFTRLRCARQP